jgi:hypothetical protein
MSTMKTNEEALDRFIVIVCDMRDALTELHGIADDHFNLAPEEIHWGHVGDVARTLEGLKEILATIRGEVK